MFSPNPQKLSTRTRMSGYFHYLHDREILAQGLSLNRLWPCSRTRAVFPTKPFKDFRNCDTLEPVSRHAERALFIIDSFHCASTLLPSGMREATWMIEECGVGPPRLMPLHATTQTVGVTRNVQDLEAKQNRSKQTQLMTASA